MSPASAATRAQALQLSVVAAQGTDLDGEWASDHWDAGRLGVPAPAGTWRGPLRHGHPGLAPRAGQALVPVPPRHRLRLLTIAAGALALSRFSRFLAERHPSVADETGITRPVLEDYLAWLFDQGYSAVHPGAVAVDAPGVLRRLPPPRLAAQGSLPTPPSMSKSSLSTTTKLPGSYPSS